MNAVNTRRGWLRFQIRAQSGHSRRTVPTHRSAYAFALGARGGILTTAMSSAARDRIQRGGGLRVAIADKESPPAGIPGRATSRLRTCWVTHCLVGCAVIPGRYTAAGPP